MSGATPAQEEAARARPLSGGLWALISWLRRDDAGSSDSLSSVGSDRTAASFAFLAPERCRPRPPLALPPPGPPTDSYKKRLRDRNARLQHDRDLTFHRKYGFFRENGGYDAFSLPPARKASAENRDPQERERRAASECVPRRAAHVPGKRRAPQPPVRSATLDARRSRKRPAPQPPRRPFADTNRDTSIPEDTLFVQMSADTDRNGPRLPKNDTPDCKPEKHIKKEVKEIKVKSEKSFLKQIFDNKKRSSTAEMIPERILPSISELDKQAAEIIESCKLKAINRASENIEGHYHEPQTRSKGDMWFCTRCLRKYNDSVVTCVHCVTEQKRKLAANASNHYTQTETSCVAPSNKVNEIEDKQKLKEMLKEIKDSLPKRTKHEVKNTTNLNSSDPVASTSDKVVLVDAPTLRIGSKVSDEQNKLLHKSFDTTGTDIKVEANNKTGNDVVSWKSTFANETAVVTQPIVLQHLPSRDIIKLDNFKVTNNSNKNQVSANFSKTINKEPSETTKAKQNDELPTTNNTNINVPLKISSLLNPESSPERHPQRSGFVLQTGNLKQEASKKENSSTIALNCTTKPVASSSSKIETGVKSQQSTNITASAALTKIFHKEQLGQKILKTTTTTQTSSDIILNSAPKLKSMENDAKDLSSKGVIKNKENVTHVNSAATVLTPPPQSSYSPEPVVSAGVTSKPIEAKIDNKDKPKTTPVHNINTKEMNQSPRSDLKTSNELPKADPQATKNIQIVSNPALKILPFDQHLKRRDLINQLEQSIAKGDQQAAAEAASKLAQLRLSCSVLSFSSQILNAPSTSSFIAPSSILKTAEVKLQTRITENLQNKADTKDVGSTSKSSVTNKIIATLTEPSTSKLPKEPENVNNTVSIEVWIEDREAARGPIKMNVSRTSVMGDLRRQADASLGLAAHLQRWIVGRTLCTDDSMPLKTLAGPSFRAPFYLCLVEPETNKRPSVPPREQFSSTAKENVNQINGNHSTDVYSELMILEQSALVSNSEDFECGICMEQYTTGQGAVLRECVHIFCRDCLSDVVKHSEDPVVSCPAMGCPGILQEREIRALVSPDEYERWLAKGLAAAENGTRNAFHCRTRDCTGWALCEPGVTRFPCPVCRRTNCVSCQAIHEGETCEQFRAKQETLEDTNNANTANETDEGTKAFLDTLISRGEALECPECKAIITKKWGCDWIKCSACKTEICWVTRGRRWGPGGRGDTSAGCRCGVDGKRCHPSCGYCH